jgi:isopenicillin N synthase-like dioxygenase
MEKKYLVGELETKGLVQVSCPVDLREAVVRAVESWKVFCSLPENARRQFPYNSSAGMGVGYELKQTSGANLDVKEDFHFALGSEGWITGIAEEMKNPVVSRFVDDARSLAHAMEPLVLDFAQDLERRFALEGLAQEVADSEGSWFVRFLHYFGNRREGDEIATPHADKSGFTLHLYESDPGLQYLDFKKNWQEMPVSAAETAIIPGMRLQYRSRGQLKAMFHRVVATKETAVRGRFSAVCFVHLNHTPAYDKQKSGRLQEFQPGFNYEMPFEEFSKLFISQ